MVVAPVDVSEDVLRHDGGWGGEGTAENPVV